MYSPIPTYRGFAYPWQVDHVGHMNVQFYTARFDEASWQFLAALGLTPALWTTGLWISRARTTRRVDPEAPAPIAAEAACAFRRGRTKFFSRAAR